MIYQYMQQHGWIWKAYVGEKKKNQKTEKTTCSVILFMWNSRMDLSYSDRKLIGVCQGLGWRLTAKGHEGIFAVM